MSFSDLSNTNHLEFRWRRLFLVIFHIQLFSPAVWFLVFIWPAFYQRTQRWRDDRMTQPYTLPLSLSLFFLIVSPSITVSLCFSLTLNSLYVYASPPVVLLLSPFLHTCFSPEQWKSAVTRLTIWTDIYKLWHKLLSLALCPPVLCLTYRHMLLQHKTNPQLIT